MPITQSANRALRKDRKRNLVNNKVRLKLRTSVKQFRHGEADISLQQVHSIIDRAAKTKIIHKNKAARLKSQLAKIAKSSKKTEAKSKTTSAKKQTKAVSKKS